MDTETVDGKDMLPQNLKRKTTASPETSKSHSATLDMESPLESTSCESSSNSSNSSSVARSTPDSFLYETKYVVLSFLKHLPKDIEERTWTPISSTPSSDTGRSEKSSNSPRKHRGIKLTRGRQGVTRDHHDNRPQSSEGHYNSDLSDHPHLTRSISCSSSQGNGSCGTEADDEMGSSSSQSSQRTDSAQDGNFLNGFHQSLFCDDLVEDGPEDEASQDSETKGLLTEDNRMDVDSGRNRTQTLSSTKTVVPEMSDRELEEDYQEDDAFKDSPKANRSHLHLDLEDCCFQKERNLAESVTTVIRESSCDLESEMSDAVSQGRLTSSQMSVAYSLASPETQVANMLVSIADRVEAQYGERLEMALQNAFRVDVPTIPYDQFQNAISSVVDDSLNGWVQVAVFLLYSQRLTLAMVQSGQRKVNYLVDYTAHLIADRAADFIINQGGWGSLAEADIYSSPLNISEASGDSSRSNSPSKLERYENVGVGENCGQPVADQETNGDNSCIESQPGQLVTNSELNSSCNLSQDSSVLSAETILGSLHHFGFRISVAAALTVIGVAVLLSKP